MRYSKNSREETACFVGPAINFMPWFLNEEDPRYIALQRAVRELVERAIVRGYKSFLCSMERGFDMIVAEVILEMKEKFPEIKIIGVLTCSEQAEKWHHPEKVHFQNLLKKLDDYFSAFYGDFGWETSCKRNEEMINASSLMIVLRYDNPYVMENVAIKYAKEQGVEIVFI